MSGGEGGAPPKSTALDNVSASGKKTSDEIAPLGRQVTRHRRERYEDWAFFTLYIFLFLDFTFFVTVKIWWLPWAVCGAQFLVLCCLIWKKGGRESLRLVNSFLMRIVADGSAKSDFAEADITVPSVAVSAQKDSSEELESLKAARNQDWFIFIVLSFIFLDVIFFSAFGNWAAPISLLILEGFALFSLAEKMGMAAIRELISRLLGTAAEKAKK